MRPPWWWPFARRRWDLARANEVVAAVTMPTLSDGFRERLRERSRRRMHAVNEATDHECADADRMNGFPLWTVQRALRNRDGEQ